MRNSKLLNEVLNKSLENVNLENKILKAVEELGELSRVFLKVNNSVNSTAGLENKEDDLKKELLEEALDSYLVIIDIINTIKEKFNFSQEEIDNLLEEKINKWAKKLK